MWLASTCPVCGTAGSAPCVPCRRLLTPIGAVSPPVGVDRAVAVLAYHPHGAAVVGAIKYRNRRACLPWLAGLAASMLDEPVDLITWAPTTRDHRRQRGFDQAQLLARGVARRLHVPARARLVRLGASQTGRSRTERLTNPRFVARPCSGTVVVVDDVLTTGATISAAAHALRWAGAARVVAVVGAHRLWRDTRHEGERMGTIR